jgi:MFS family permease
VLSSETTPGRRRDHRRPGVRLARPGARALASAALLTTVGVLPVFLLGGLAVLVRTDIGFTESQLGMSVAAYFAAGALGSIPAGRLAERFGARRALHWGAGLSTTSLLGCAVISSWGQLTALLVVGGLSNALIQVAANLLLSGAISSERQGVAFVVKQAAIPAATLLGGLAVPVLGITLGWRWAFVAAAAAALAAGATARGVGSSPVPSKDRGAITTPWSPLIVLAVGVGLGAAAANSLGAFLVEYVVSTGWSPAAGGAVLAAGSVAGICARVGMGWLADKGAAGTLWVVAAQLAVGALAFAVLPLVDAGAVVLVVLLAFAAGWGWPGLFNFLIVRHNPAAPAAATGVTQAGVYTGGVLGPLAFGFVVERSGYDLAWMGAAGSLLLAAVLVVMGRQFLTMAPRRI